MINSSPKFGGAYIAKSRNADTPNLKILNLAFESGSSEISRVLCAYRVNYDWSVGEGVANPNLEVRSP